MSPVESWPLPHRRARHWDFDFGCLVFECFLHKKIRLRAGGSGLPPQILRQLRQKDHKLESILGYKSHPGLLDWTIFISKLKNEIKLKKEDWRNTVQW